MEETQRKFFRRLVQRVPSTLFLSSLLVSRGSCVLPGPLHKNVDAKTGLHSAFLAASMLAFQTCSCLSLPSLPSSLPPSHARQMTASTADPLRSVFTWSTCPLSSMALSRRVSTDFSRPTATRRLAAADTLQSSLKNVANLSFARPLRYSPCSTPRALQRRATSVTPREETRVSSAKARYSLEPRLHMGGPMTDHGRFSEGNEDLLPNLCGPISESSNSATDTLHPGLLSTAPMMDNTDSHWRKLMSLMSRHLTLYTEMVAVPPEFSSCCYLPSSAASLNAGASQSQQHEQRVLQRLVDEVSSCMELSNPCVLQLGLSCTQAAYSSARAIAQAFFRGLNAEENNRRRSSSIFLANLNCGCPSPRVARCGTFGLSLMKDASRVGEICRRLHEGFSVVEASQVKERVDGHGEGEREEKESMPSCLSGLTSRFFLSVKCRIGIAIGEEEKKSMRRNDLGYYTGSPPVDSGTLDKSSSTCTYDSLASFIDIVSSTSPVKHFEVHARPGILEGFTPRQNRTIPELKPAWVYRLCKDFPYLSFTLNGGISSFEEAESHFLNSEDELGGVMVGRGILERPWYWASGADAFIGRQRRRRGRGKSHGAERNRRSPAAVDSGTGRGTDVPRYRKERQDVDTRRQPGGTALQVEEAYSSVEENGSPNRVASIRSKLDGSSSRLGESCQRISDTPVGSLAQQKEEPGTYERYSFTRREVLYAYANYADYMQRRLLLREQRKKEIGQGGTKREKEEKTGARGEFLAVLKPLWNLFVGERGSRAFRQALQNPESEGVFETRSFEFASELGRGTGTDELRKARSGDEGCYDGNDGSKDKQVYVQQAARRKMMQTRDSLGDIIRRAMTKVPDEVLDRRGQQP